MDDQSRSVPAGEQVECHQCGHHVPPLEYCIVCGHPLADEKAAAWSRYQYAAAPEEPALAVRVFSTLFPQLPRADLDAFRLILAIGTASVVVLAVAGLYAVAFVGAAMLVPLLVALYMWDVDIYEDAPGWMLGLTMAWGALSGLAAGLIRLELQSGIVPLVDGVDMVTLLALGVFAPIVEFALIAPGPLVLFRQRRFNDVLDGAAIGAVTGVAFAGGSAIGAAIDLIRAGSALAGDTHVWVLLLLTTAVLRPIVYATAAGGAAAALWLLYRAPVADRPALGLVGRPVIAAGLALAVLIIAAVASLLLDVVLTGFVLVVLAAAGLVWLRRAIHLGLLQESREREITGQAVCANCQRASFVHTFCGHCGIALAALPKRRRTTSRDARGADS